MTVHFLWLVVKYVPLHAAALRGLGAPLPATTRICIEGALWTVRILPFLIVSAAVVLLPGVVAFGVYIATTRRSLDPGLLRGVAALALAVTFVGCLASAFVVHAMHSPYRAIAVDPEYQKSVNAYREWRENRPAPPCEPPPAE